MVIVIQSYTRLGWSLQRPFDAARRKLGVTHADFLLLGWWNQAPPARIRDAAAALVE